MLNVTLHMLCICSVAWLLTEKIQIFVERPTTASLEMIDSKNIPVSFTLCEFLYNSKFDGKFNDHTLTNIENISVVYNNTKLELLDESDLEFDFISFFGWSDVVQGIWLG